MDKIQLDYVKHLAQLGLLIGIKILVFRFVQLFQVYLDIQAAVQKYVYLHVIQQLLDFMEIFKQIELVYPFVQPLQQQHLAKILVVYAYHNAIMQINMEIHFIQKDIVY